MLCAAYGWTPATVANLTTKQSAYFLRHLPDIELRRHYSLAHLEATILNALGGKRPPEGKSDRPLLRPDELWSPIERLPYFAVPAWAAEARGGGIPQDAARDFLANTARMPAWVVEIAPLAAIKAAA